MQAEFANPPRNYRMLQIIHGFPKGDRLEEVLDFLAGRGYGGVVCNVGFDDYLESEEEWQHFLRGFEECRRRGLRVWLYDEKGYPSGKAGTLTLRGHPEYEVRGLVCAQTTGTGRIRHLMPADERVEGAPVAVWACPVDGDELDLSRQVDLRLLAGPGQDALEWDPPQGEWTVLSFHVRRMREGTHIVCNVSDDNPYINIMDPAAVRRFIEVTHEQYATRLGPDLAANVEAMFTDEPSLMTYYLKPEEGLLPAVPWLDGLATRFEAQHGYDLVPRLPALVGDCGPGTARTRLDFWHTVSQLVEGSFYGQIEDWCTARGIAASGHALTEEQLHWHVGFEGDMYRDLRRMDIPGLDQLSSDPAELVRAECIPVEKLVSSVAHMRRGKGCMSETSNHQQRMHKQPSPPEHWFGTANFQYALGVTQIASYWQMDELPPELMQEFNDHIGRLGRMLNDGRHVAQVAVYYPIHTCWAGFQAQSQTAYEGCQGALGAKVSEVFGHVSRALLWSQVDFDYVDDEAIAEADIEGGSLSVAGEAFRALVLPHTVAIPLSTWRKVAEFVQAGGCLVCCGPLPSIASTNGTDEDVQAISDEIGQGVRVEVVDEPAAVPHALGYFVDLDVALSEPCRDLLYNHRVLDGRHVYFLANCGGAQVACDCTLAVQGQAELWHPRTGEIRGLACSAEAWGTTIQLDLAPFEGVLIVFEAGAHWVPGDQTEAGECCFQRTGHCGACHEAATGPTEPL